ERGWIAAAHVGGVCRLVCRTPTGVTDDPIAVERSLAAIGAARSPTPEEVADARAGLEAWIAGRALEADLGVDLATRSAHAMLGRLSRIAASTPRHRLSAALDVARRGRAGVVSSRGIAAE